MQHMSMRMHTWGHVASVHASVWCASAPERCVWRLAFPTTSPVADLFDSHIRKFSKNHGAFPGEG